MRLLALALLILLAACTPFTVTTERGKLRIEIDGPPIPRIEPHVLPEKSL